MKDRYYKFLSVLLAVFVLAGGVLGISDTVWAGETVGEESMQMEVKGDAGTPAWYGGAYSTYNPFAWSDLYGQCTWYAYGRAYERTGVALEACRIGNACTWYSSAQSAGFRVGSTPRANSVAVFNTSSGYGHVAYVESVSGDTVLVSEANNSALGNWTSQTQSTLVAGINCYSGQHSWTVSQMRNRYASESLIGYIYLVDDPEPGALSISARSTYYTDENITFSWNTPANTATYGISLYTRPGSGDRQLVYDKASVTGNSYNIGKWTAGNYRLWMAPYNVNGTRGTAVYVDISVTKRPVTYVTGISLSSTSLTLTKGQSGKLTATVAPTNATNKSITWTTSDSKVATVSGGTVKVVGVGTATITAKATDGSGKTASCKVTVKDTHKHSYTAKITKAATCTSTGLKTYTCSCGAKYTESIAKKNHNFKQASVRKASVNKNGVITQKCSGCGKEKQITIYAPKEIKLSGTNYVYNGRNYRPAVTVTDSNGQVLTNGTDYNVSYPKDSKKVGKYSVTITFQGNYTGKCKQTYTIAPETTKLTGYHAKSSKSITIYWSKQKNQTTGYEIQYSTNENFSKSATKKITVNKNATTSKTLSKLKKGKTYYVRIRTYKTVRVNNKSVKIYSDWSDTLVVSR